MAGAGRKVWGAETVTYPDLQNFLQDQVVQVYASAAARTAAVPSPTEGMVSYLADLNRLDAYDAAAWQPIAYTSAQRTQGSISASTDGGGTYTFNHSLGAAPISVQLTPYNSAVQHVAKLVVSAVSGTQVQVVMYNSTTGAAIASNPIAFGWVAYR